MNGFQKSLLLIGLGAALHFSAQHWLAWPLPLPKAAPASRVEPLDLPERVYRAPPAPRYDAQYEQVRQEDISARVQSVAADARAFIARYGYLPTSVYTGGARTTPVDASEHDRSRYTGDVGNILWRETHE